MSTTLAKKSQHEINRFSELLLSARESQDSGDLKNAFDLYKETIQKVKQELKHRPQDKHLRANLMKAWEAMSQLYPDLSELEQAPEVKSIEMSESGEKKSNSVLKTLKTVFVDSLIESDWRKQCNGKYGGEKPSDLSWKEFYLENESHLEQFKTLKEKIVWATKYGHGMLLKKLLEKAEKSDIEGDSDSNSDSGPLFFAVKNQYYDLVELLLNKDAKISVTGEADWSLLHWAVFNENMEMVKLLINRNIKVNSVDVKGISPLHWASFKGNSSLVSYLIEHGAKVNCENSDGVTPLYWAVFNDHYMVASLLLDTGSKVDMQDKFGRTLLHWAVNSDRYEMVKLLIEKGAPIGVKDNLGRTPLHWATQKGNLDIVMYLVEKGSDLNNSDIFGEKILTIAAFCNYSRVVTYLFQEGARG